MCWETTAALWSADQRQLGLMPVGVMKMFPVLICLCCDASWDEREEAAAAAAAASPTEPGPAAAGAAGSAAACY